MTTNDIKGQIVYTLRIKSDLFNEIKEIAIKNKRTMPKQIELIFENFLKKKGN